MTTDVATLPGWMCAPLPVGDADEVERRRLRSLRSCDLLDTPPEDVFDDAVALAAQVCATPVAFLSLLDEDRQWFKAVTGTDLRETPRSVSFCNVTVDVREPVVVPDTREDPRFRDNPLVTGAPGIRAYAGVPLVLGDGAAVGTVCVLDGQARPFAPEQVRSLVRVSSIVREIVELRRQAGVRAESGRWNRAVPSTH